MTTEDRVNSLERQVATTMAKVDMIIGELRDRDNQRAQEISQLRQKHDADMRDMNQRFYQKFDDMDKKIDSKFDKLSTQIQNLTIAAIVGIGAIVLGGGAIVWSAITTLK